MRELILFSYLCFSTTGVSASFGEMLLLVAMYFHSNQLNAIIDLVCSTLGMKVNYFSIVCLGQEVESIFSLAKGFFFRTNILKIFTVHAQAPYLFGLFIM